MKNRDKPIYPAKGATYKISGDPERIDLEYQDNGTIKFPGLTKREYFAAMALQGLMAVNDKGSFENKQEMIAEGVNRAIMAADELLKQLES